MHAAEQRTGLQFAVYLGPTEEASRQVAERLFTDTAAADVLLLISTSARRVEILTAPAVRTRLPDEQCEDAIERMRPHLARRRWDRALVVGIERLADAAGPGERAAGASDVPDLFDES